MHRIQLTYKFFLPYGWWKIKKEKIVVYSCPSALKKTYDQSEMIKVCSLTSMTECIISYYYKFRTIEGCHFNLGCLQLATAADNFIIDKNLGANSLIACYRLQESYRGKRWWNVARNKKAIEQSREWSVVTSINKTVENHMLNNANQP